MSFLSDLLKCVYFVYLFRGYSPYNPLSSCCIFISFISSTQTLGITLSVSPTKPLPFALVPENEINKPTSSLSEVMFNEKCCCCPVTKSFLTLCDLMDCNTSGFPVLHYLPNLTQTHVHWAGDANQPSPPLSPSSLPALSLSQYQGLFQWVSSSHQVAKVSELQLYHQSFQWTFRVDFL